MIPPGFRSELTQQEREARRAKGLQLLLTGHTYQSVADQCGYGSRQAAHKDLQPAWEAARKEWRESRDDAVNAILSRMDDALTRVREVMEEEHPLVSDGRVVYDADGNPLIDRGPLMAAIDRMVKVDMERRKLMGYDAATKVEATQTVTYQIVGVDPEDV